MNKSKNMTKNKREGKKYLLQHLWAHAKKHLQAARNKNAHFNFRRPNIRRPARIALLPTPPSILLKNLLRKQDLRKGTIASESFPVETQEMCSDNKIQQI